MIGLLVDVVKKSTIFSLCYICKWYTSLPYMSFVVYILLAIISGGSINCRNLSDLDPSYLASSTNNND